MYPVYLNLEGRLHTTCVSSVSGRRADTQCIRCICGAHLCISHLRRRAAWSERRGGASRVALSGVSGPEGAARRPGRPASPARRGCAWGPSTRRLPKMEAFESSQAILSAEKLADAVSPPSHGRSSGAVRGLLVRCERLGTVADLLVRPEGSARRAALAGRGAAARSRALPERRARLGRPGEGCWLLAGSSGLAGRCGLHVAIPCLPPWCQELELTARLRASRVAGRHCFWACARRVRALLAAAPSGTPPQSRHGLPALQLVAFALMRVRGCARVVDGRQVLRIGRASDAARRDAAASWSKRGRASSAARAGMRAASAGMSSTPPPTPPAATVTTASHATPPLASSGATPTWRRRTARAHACSPPHPRYNPNS